MKPFKIILFGFLIGFSGCQFFSPSITPEPSIAPTITSLPRWRIYEIALSKATLHKEDALSEWQILGRSNDEVYVLTECQARGPVRTAVYGPVVIYLAGNGEIDKVVMPRDGNYYNNDIRNLFPSYLWDEIYGFSLDGPQARKHIDERMTSNAPPLIALSGTPLP
jgi:hypothetical protein